jgi:hypothetical protein
VAYFVFASDAAEPIRCDTLGAAISEACRRLGAGGGILHIKGSDGLMMERSDIILECERRRASRSEREIR